MSAELQASDDRTPEHAPVSDDSPLLALDDVRVEIEGSQVVRGVSFELGRVGITALLGRNGAGKTTTIRSILNLAPSVGGISMNGISIQGWPTHRIVRAGIGYVPEDREVFGGLTVEENLRLAEQKGVDPDYDTIHAIFPELKDRRHQKAGSLSGGQQQMVALARVLLNPTVSLLVDEPTKGLAPKLVTEVADILARVAEVTPLLLVEQNLPMVKRIAHRALVLDTGSIVFDGEASLLLDDDDLTNQYLGVSTGKESS